MGNSGRSEDRVTDGELESSREVVQDRFTVTVSSPVVRSLSTLLACLLLLESDNKTKCQCSECTRSGNESGVNKCLSFCSRNRTPKVLYRTEPPLEMYRVRTLSGQPLQTDRGKDLASDCAAI